MTRTMTIEVIWGSGSPYAWRVLLTLEVKGLPYESRLIQFSRGDHRSPEHLALNPRGKVPVLRDGDYVLSESLAIMAYLDRKHPEPPLFGSSAEETGLIWKAIFEFQSYVAPLAERIVVPAFRDPTARRRRHAGGRGRAAWRARPHGAGRRRRAAGSPGSGSAPPTSRSIRSSRRCCAPPARRRSARWAWASCRWPRRYPALEGWRQRIAALPGYARTYPPHWREAA